MERRARRDNAIGRKRRSSRAPSDADATPQQTAWFIIIAGEESGVYEGMRWDGREGKAAVGQYLRCILCHRDVRIHQREKALIKKDGKGTDFDIDVGVETCRVMIRGGEGPIQVPSPSCSSCLSGEL